MTTIAIIVLSGIGGAIGGLFGTWFRKWWMHRPCPKTNDGEHAPIPITRYSCLACHRWLPRPDREEIGA